jgi:hypothetical protein
MYIYAALVLFVQTRSTLVVSFKYIQVKRPVGTLNSGKLYVKHNLLLKKRDFTSVFRAVQRTEAIFSSVLLQTLVLSDRFKTRRSLYCLFLSYFYWSKTEMKVKNFPRKT